MPGDFPFAMPGTLGRSPGGAGKMDDHSIAFLIIADKDLLNQEHQLGPGSPSGGGVFQKLAGQ